MKGQSQIQGELCDGLSSRNFTYYGDGLVEVENFTKEYLAENECSLTTFKMEEFPGRRRWLRIYYSDKNGSPCYIEYGVFDSL